MNDELLEALLALRVAVAALRHELDTGAEVTILQVDRDSAEDGRTHVATAHLSDGLGIAAFVDPWEFDSGGRVIEMK